MPIAHAAPDSLIQFVSLCGAGLILVGYAGQHLGKFTPTSSLYLLCNALGAVFLGYVAFFPFNAGFVVLETFWLAITGWTFVRASRARRDATGTTLSATDPLSSLDAGPGSDS